MNFRQTQKNSGFTLVEILVALGIFVVIGVSLATFERDIFSLNSFIQADLNAQFAGRRTIVRMISEMREMSQSSLGSYPIASAATSSLMFYSDIDADTVKEQIRYYVQGNDVLRSVVEPTGNPLTYNQGDAVVTTVVPNILNGTSTPLFQYYDGAYAGTTTPLAMPVNVSSVRLIKPTFIIERRSSNPSRVTITSQVTIRNLKDNF